MAVTTTKGIIKMPDEGDTITLHIVKCEVVEGKFGEQVKFTDTRGDALYISRATADRQLGRCGFVDGELVLYGDVDGNTLVFSRDPNKSVPSKPYWGIQRVVAEDTSHRPSLKEAAQAEAERVRKAKGLPVDDDGGSMGPTIPGLDGEDSAYLESLEAMDDDGMPPQKAAPAPTDKAAQYFALAERVAEFQAKLCVKYEAPFEIAAVNAMSYSIWGIR